MPENERSAVKKGSRRWAAHVAEIASWGTALVIFAVLHLADMPRDTYTTALQVLGGLAVWLLALFRLTLPRTGHLRWVVWLSIAFGLGFAGSLYGLLADSVASAQLLFVPVIVATGLLASFPEAVAAAILAIGAYWGVAEMTGNPPGLVSGAFDSGIFLLSGSVAGLLARELRSHYRGELEEHRLATAVRLRLLAVLDAIDEGIVFRNRQDNVGIVNRRAGELFEVDPDDHLGSPVVEFLRLVARKAEDPEGFMEAFQQLRDDPELELRFEIEQILPERRNIRVYSGPTFDESGVLVGRIDVYTDVTETVRRAAEVERLYEDARKTAESYQRGLLPDSVPSLPRLSMVAHYVPAAGERAVCGDFYDFVPLPEAKMGFVLGDVCGVGPEALSDAALTRYTLRSFSGEISEPAGLLTWMNGYLSTQLPSERFVRLFFGALDPERAAFEFANAGHVPPVVFRARSGDVEWLEEGGLPLGIEEESSYKTGRVELEPGDMLVFYTDGVTEAPRHGRPFGQGKFMDLVAEYGVGTPGELVQAIGRCVDAWVTELRDDLALLVCQVVPDAAVEELVRELVLPNDSVRIADVRRFVAAFLAELRAPVEVSSEILLAAGEAAANANRHGRRTEGRSEIRVSCHFDRPNVVLSVADDGPGFDPAAIQVDELPDPFAAGGRGLFLMRALMDDVDVDSSADGTTVTMARRLFGAA